MITGLNHITLSVSDLEKSFRFYSETLGFIPVAKWENGTYLEAGDLWLALLVGSNSEKRSPSDYSHIAFSCEVHEFGPLTARLEAAGHNAWQENRSEGDSYYFLDPDGHKLEIHLGNLETRLKSMKEEPWGEITFFR
ncbi:MAG: VOC family protein [Pseudomonadota bacterium]